MVDRAVGSWSHEPGFIRRRRESHPFPRARSRLRSRGALAICMGCRFSGLETHTGPREERFSWPKPADATAETYACVGTNSRLSLILLLRRFILDASIGASKKTRGRTRPLRLATSLQQRSAFSFPILGVPFVSQPRRCGFFQSMGCFAFQSRSTAFNAINSGGNCSRCSPETVPFLGVHFAAGKVLHSRFADLSSAFSVLNYSFLGYSTLHALFFGHYYVSNWH